MWKICQSLNLASLFSIEEKEMRRTVVHASGVNNQALAVLATTEMKLRETVVVLCTIDRYLGHARMPELLGVGADPRFIGHVAEQLRNEGIASLQDPREIWDVTLRVLNHLKMVGHLT
jgi:hypothetical protein